MYIFGYGSLINSHSRQLTGQTGKAIPAVIQGLQRCWGKVDGSYKIAPLVARIGEGRCNGVLVAVDDIALKEFDRREKGYHRVRVNLDSITSVIDDFTFEENETVWVYVKDNTEAPCEHQPIVQTYVDTVLAGCLSISESFANTFVETTHGWHHPLENDRHKPKYGNLAGVLDEHLYIIDSLIQQVRLPLK
ncbi:gamma-glutamylcyclotransferase [Photobacterium profundum]|uniref:Gamma-glutamylcyclotransferase AIG2-like domain-containing protein n=1 Tax=Photobacterium profundum 3TCK TaxID=314280 RepID=Q1YWN2_9GAMM|nr:gamma-glutamylcyclotransferase family protein [Photobacterium profundum]EAS40689.1 hypothetical protein P3TCK_17309 [Photobacterium profundum 3TCK]PSV64235.1 gamma-glutamylcyclotransferase [Photobacterium profundum]